MQDADFRRQLVETPQPFHLALAYFKLAVILEGIHYRYLQGQTLGEGFDRIGEWFDLIISSGLQALREG